MSGGIIRGFLGGAGKAMAQAGQMMFIDQLRGERDEANFLRNKALRAEERAADQEFRTSEREAGEEYRTKERETDVQTQKDAATEKAKTDSALQTQRDKAAMERSKLTARSKSPKNPQLIKYTDSKGNEQEGVLRTNKDGSFTIVKPGGVGTVEENIKPSTADMAQTIKEYDDLAEYLKSDISQFGMSEKRWKKRRSVEIALERMERERSGKSGKKAGGIIGPMMEPGAGKDTDTGAKMIAGKRTTKQQFIDAMVVRYGQDALPDIEKTWESIK